MGQAYRCTNSEGTYGGPLARRGHLYPWVVNDTHGVHEDQRTLMPTCTLDAHGADTGEPARFQHSDSATRLWAASLFQIASRLPGVSGSVEQRAARDTGTSHHDRRRCRVLLVEEAGEAAATISAALSGSGCDVICVESGWAGLELAWQARPDVIMLDWQLLDMESAEFIEAYRAQDGTTPVVLLTAQPRAATVGRQIGADAILGKPFTIEKLVETLRPYLDCV